VADHLGGGAPPAWAYAVWPVSASITLGSSGAPSGETSAGCLLPWNIPGPPRDVVVRNDQVSAGPLEIPGKQQMRIGNDNGARRRMCGNTVDVNVSTQVSALDVRQHVGKLPAKVKGARRRLG